MLALKSTVTSVADDGNGASGDGAVTVPSPAMTETVKSCRAFFGRSSKMTFFAMSCLILVRISRISYWFIFIYAVYSSTFLRDYVQVLAQAPVGHVIRVSRRGGLLKTYGILFIHLFIIYLFFQHGSAGRVRCKSVLFFPWYFPPILFIYFIR